MECETPDCDRKQEWKVERPDGQLRRVCGDCRDELMAVYGYELVR